MHKKEQNKERAHQGLEQSSPQSGKTLSPPPFQLKAEDTGSDGGSGGKGNLPGDLVNGFQASTGHNLGDVKVHHNSEKPSQVGAHAFAQGNDIYLAQGQEKHLPHEAAHIVQQREGMVKPTTEINGQPVNDSNQLEKEADKMGETALQMKSASGAPGVQKKSSPVVQRQVIQRAKTWGGEFKPQNYFPVDKNGVQTNENDQKTGINMELEFHPGKKVDAKQIGMLQSVNTVKEGTPTALNPTVENRSIPTGEDGEGVHIDQSSTNRNPLYAVEAPPTTDSNLTDTGANANWGQHGYRYTDSAGSLQKEKAILKDTPNIRAHKKNSKQIFEATALAIEGNQEGTYYGSVQWGWETDDKGKFKKIPVKTISQGVPSGEFIRAAELWNSTDTASGDSTLDIPLPRNIVLTKQPTKLLTDPQEGSKKIKTLPANQRLEDLGTSTDGFAKVKIVDGKGNVGGWFSSDIMYETGWVKEDQIHDER